MNTNDLIIGIVTLAQMFALGTVIYFGYGYLIQLAHFVYFNRSYQTNLPFKTVARLAWKATVAASNYFDGGAVFSVIRFNQQNAN